MDLWALQTYGQRPGSSSAAEFWRVACVAQLLVVVWSSRGPLVSLHRVARAVGPSLAIVVVLSWLSVRADQPLSTLPNNLAAVSWVWLSAAALLAKPLSRATRHSGTDTPVSLAHPPGIDESPRVSALVVVLELGAASILLGLGLTMPMMTRGLISDDRLGITDQIHAMLTGYSDPTATHLVASYTVLLVALLAARHAVRRVHKSASCRSLLAQRH